MTGPVEARPLRGRPGTKALPLADARAVGGPIAFGLLAAYAAVALAAWLAAAVVLVLAAPALAAGDPLAARPVLAAHLIALGVLPFAVTAASFHLLPVMLRNDVGHPRALRLALPLLGGGFLVAPGLALDVPGLVWPGATLVAAGLGIVLVELAGLALRAPRGRTLVASRTGVLLVCLHVAAALVLGALVFSHGDEPFGGVGHDRWVLAHLHLAVVGWLALLIVTVGRTLAPMLALGPTAPGRKLPVTEVVLTAGLWALLGGIAGASTAAAAAGGAVVLAALAAFGAAAVRILRSKRTPVEAPLAHMLAGVVFLLHAAVLGFLVLAGAVSAPRVLTAYVIFLLLGWAAGVTIGHLGKLIALSLWVWWPPGPRPKQASLYPRTTWLTETAVFATGLELLGLGTLAGSAVTARAGAAVLVAAALLAAAGAVLTWTRRYPSASR